MKPGTLSDNKFWILEIKMWDQVKYELCFYRITGGFSRVWQCKQICKEEIVKMYNKELGENSI